MLKSDLIRLFNKNDIDHIRLPNITLGISELWKHLIKLYIK